MPPLIALAGAVALIGGLVAGVRSILNRSKRIGVAVIVDPDEHTRVDEQGSVHSVQAADLTLPADVVERIWDPHHLERLARTYWRFLSRATLGIVRVRYTETGRYIVAFAKPFTLLSFHAPDYHLTDDVGIVRWRIRKGVLVARRGHEGDGYLEIEVRRCERLGDRVRLHVRVEVANFYPMIASSIAMWVYKATQSRLHVIVTHGFLRSLAKLDLAESRVQRFPPRTTRRPRFPRRELELEREREPPIRSARP